MNKVTVDDLKRDSVKIFGWCSSDNRNAFYPDIEHDEGVNDE